jgi:hypothetical protein
MFFMTRIKFSKAIVVCLLYLKAANVYFLAHIYLISIICVPSVRKRLADSIRPRSMKIEIPLCFNLGLLQVCNNSLLLDFVMRVN